MKSIRLLLPTLMAIMPIAAVLAFGSSCILNDDFLKTEGQFPCAKTSECSEPGYQCRSGFCSLPAVGGDPCTTADQDKDGDGYGSGMDRRNCEFPLQDLDDDCAECTPGAPEACDGKDNNTDGTIDEPIACTRSFDCPNSISGIIPAASQWSCREGVCVVVPQRRPPGSPCEDVVIACVQGAYDTTEADANSCLE